MLLKVSTPLNYQLLFIQTLINYTLLVCSDKVFEMDCVVPTLRTNSVLVIRNVPSGKVVIAEFFQVDNHIGKTTVHFFDDEKTSNSWLLSDFEIDQSKLHTVDFLTSREQPLILTDNLQGYVSVRNAVDEVIKFMRS